MNLNHKKIVTRLLYVVFTTVIVNVAFAEDQAGWYKVKEKPNWKMDFDDIGYTYIFFDSSVSRDKETDYDYWKYQASESWLRGMIEAHKDRSLWEKHLFEQKVDVDGNVASGGDLLKRFQKINAGMNESDIVKLFGKPVHDLGTFHYLFICTKYNDNDCLTCEIVVAFNLDSKKVSGAAIEIADLRSIDKKVLVKGGILFCHSFR